MAERIGHVSEITPPPEGTNRPWSGKVGGRKIKFWGTQRGSDDPTAALLTMRDAENRGLPVRAEGLEELVNGRNGSFTSFTAREITIHEGGISQPPAQVSTFPDNKDRSIVAQVAYKIAATLAASGAIDAEGKLEGFKAIADFVFYSILETAEGKATGDAQDQGAAAQ
jgi:hypothetical protein